MKKFALIAAAGLLASCGTKEPAPEATATADAAVAAASTAAPMAGPTAGSYEVTAKDGTKTVTTITDDGKFVTRDAADKVIDKGTMAMKDGKTCFTGQDAAEDCYTDSAPAADGSFTATNAKGEVEQVRPYVKK